MRQTEVRLLLASFALLALAACGVKGDPLPPEKPVEVGRGRPTYRRATEGIRVEKHDPADDDRRDREDDDDRDE